jgi:hypothetical protein
MIRPSGRTPLVALVLLLLAACSSIHSGSLHAPEEKALASEVAIVLHEDVQLFDQTRTVTIHGDGAVRIEYRRKVDHSRTEVTNRSVEPSSVVDVINQLFDLGFLDMPAKYEGLRHTVQLEKEAAYQPLIIVSADGSCNELTLKLGEWTKTVSECNSAPEPLRKAHARIRELAAVEQFD